jgi:hypothetical protein
VKDPVEFSDADFLDWAGLNSERWAVLPRERREQWLDHIVARVRSTSDDQQRNAYWQLAYVIACSANRPAAEQDARPTETGLRH